ncbi:hypothetical protein JCM3770_003196 [Rhodotorula araucariae]
MAIVVPSLTRIHRRATRNGSVDAFTAKKLRRALKDVEGWECTDDDWKDGGLKAEVVRRWEDLLNASADEGDDASPPPAAERLRQTEANEDDDDPQAEDVPPKSKSKYDRASEKNLNTFMGAIVGDLGGGSPVDDDKPKAQAKKRTSTAFSPTPGGSSPAASGSGSGSGSPAPEQNQKKGAKRASDVGRAKKASVRPPKGGFKSAEYIADSDDSSAGVAPAEGHGDEGEGVGAGARAKKGMGKKRKDGDADAKGEGKGKERRPMRKAPEPKPGDAPKGTEEQEERIVKLKELLSVASGRRAFTAATGAERTLSVSRRTEILEGLLKDLGLPVKNGKLPSMGSAKAVGEKRALAKEMQDLSGNPLQSGLRDGKRPRGDTSESDAGDGADERALPSVAARKRQVVEQRKSFGAFLGDQSSESD